MGISKTRGDVELEILGLNVALFVGEGHNVTFAFLLESLIENGIQHWIQSLFNTGKEQWPAESKTVFEGITESLVNKAGLFAVILGFLVLNPSEALALGIDHEWIP